MYNAFLQKPVSSIPFVGPSYAFKLSKLNIKTVEDLLKHYPTRYIDFSVISLIGLVQPGETITIKGTLVSINNIYTKRGLTLQKAIVKDESGIISVIWFNQRFLIRSLNPGTILYLSGKVSIFSGKPVLESPEFEIIRTNSNPIHTGRLVPVYPLTEGVSSKWLRSKIMYALQQYALKINDYLPENIRKRYSLCPFSQAIRTIHFPENIQQLGKAKHRLSFDELFFIQLSSTLRKKTWAIQHKAPVIHKPFCHIDIQTMIKTLPFSLTKSQITASRQILSDMNFRKPMNRLLQGDVGSGKTICAAIGAYASYLSGKQTVVMAPTEILAQQHFNSLKKVFDPLGVTVTLHTGSVKDENSGDVVVGTHALLFSLHFDKTGLIVIDEQHRFGVEQRSKLIEKGTFPHVLSMTATPIPRTSALVLYSELDISYLNELPSGRLPVKTYAVPEEKRQAAYGFIRKTLKEGVRNDVKQQVFIICPFIETSEYETFESVKAVKAEYEKINKIVFPDFKVGLLHGSLPAKKKDEILGLFRQGEYDILVSTPVVEVGIDIPSATIMIIEGAERFGLAQLHQLRGRVGRGNIQSYCLLFTSENKGSQYKRLRALEKTHNGLKLAEYDLKLRGPGDIYGIKQSGFQKLKMASLTDTRTIAQTKEAVDWILKKDPLIDTKNTKFGLLHEAISQFIIQQSSPN
jgi:ATP-dependent DNA helicase RecG